MVRAASSSFSSLVAALLVVFALLVCSTGGAAGGRILLGKPVRCGRLDVFVSQGVGEPQPDGTSLYRVVVANRCGGGQFDGDGSCIISDVHLSCGNFRSAVPVNPRVLRLVGPGDCLVANGAPILVQEGNVSFVYTSYVRYEMTVLRATCIH